MFLTNDSRKIHRFLDSKFDNRTITIEEAIATEQAILKYYPNPIISIVTDMLKKAKPEKLANYANFSYHLPAMRRITSKRSVNPPIIIGWNEFRTVFELMQKLLVVDYNHDTLLIMIEIAKGLPGSWSHMDLMTAINTAITCGARSPAYVMAIIQKAFATKQAKIIRANEIADTAQPVIATKDKSISFIETLSIMAQWEDRKINNDLERKVKELYK